MRLWNSLTRFLTVTCITGFALLGLLFVLVQVQQQLLRYRAEKLLADFHSIRLNHSTWTDAQILMRRWGAWGHYDGTCTPTDCSYFITLEDQGSVVGSHLSDIFEKLWPQHYSGQTFYRVYQHLGGRIALMRVGFLVQDGIIHRSGVGLRIAVSPKEAGDEYGYGLMLLARANDHLRQTDPHESWILGDEEQLAQHPEYKVGRPSGCTICMAGEVTFTPYLSQAEIRRLTSYNLSCLIGWHICRILPDILPAAVDWHLYPPLDSSWLQPLEPPLTSCGTPAYAPARDAANVIVVKVLSTQLDTQLHSEQSYPDSHASQQDRVLITEVLKGNSTADRGTIFTAIPFSGDYDDPTYTAENLQVDKEYILFDGPIQAQETKVALRHCGAVEATPKLKQQVTDGINRRDHLRRADTFRLTLW